MTTTMGRGFWKWGLLTLAMTGCGGVMGEEAQDEPMLTLEGTLHASESFEAGDSNQMRAALLWEVFPPAVLDCMVQTTVPDALTRCQRMSPKQSFHNPGVDVKVNSRFPNTFSMSLNRLPEPGGLMGEEGSRIGFASVLAYVDGNGNRKLDRVPLEATSSSDIIVGHQEGYRGDDLEYFWIAYREGTLHPIFETLFPDCPVIPQGYSVLTYRYKKDPSNPDGDPIFEGCFLKTRKAEFNIILEARRDFQQLACEVPNQFVLADVVRATTAGPPPSGSTQRCRTYIYPVGHTEQVLLVNNHPERFCTAANSVVYSLRDFWGATWDDRASPPAWWPCTP